MKYNPEDPKLTAYALGELEDTERTEYETLVAENAEVRRAVEEICQTTSVLTEELKREPTEQFTPDQYAVINRTLLPDPWEERSFNWRNFWLTTGLSAAAAMIIAMYLLPPLNAARGKARHASTHNQQMLEALPARVEREPLPEPPAAYSPPLPAAPAASEPGEMEAKAPQGAAGEVIGVFADAATSIGRIETPRREAPSLQTYTKEHGDAITSNYDANSRTGGNDAEKSRENIRLWSVSRSWLPPSGSERNEKRSITPYMEDYSTESYDHISDNAFFIVTRSPLSTFSIDVDTASYANIRRFLNDGSLPPRDAVRIEEMINYFSYNYPQPRGEHPFSANAEIADCPWNEAHRLMRIGLKGKEIRAERRPPSNLVFLIDVSGSMQSADKLPLVQRSLRMLVEQLTEDDHVAIVVYAGSSGLVLPATNGENKRAILNAIDRLEAGGSTHGSAGIQQAYEIAQEQFIKRGVNRVILCTDGDFNVGVTNQDDLTRLIEEKAKSGVFLSVLGFGTGNLRDSTMEKLADKGNGQYAYIDSIDEGRKVFVEQMSGTLVTIAKDVKIQIEFNPAQVQSYRLIGYENRIMRHEDFNNDKKDAGDIGAGHTVTALYEIVPANGRVRHPDVDPLKYQPSEPVLERNASGEICTLKLRYKQPDGKTSKLMEYVITDDGYRLGRASEDFRFVAAVAEFGMLLRDSEYKGEANYEEVIALAKDARGEDENGYRSEFVELVKKARNLSR